MSNQTGSTRPPPEKKFPVARSSEVAVWLNKGLRSTSISPPQFKDQQGNYRDGSFYMNELPMLIYALEQALAYCYSAPIPSQDNDPPPI